MLISVIIPVYNGEKYIDKCLNSVISQNYKNLEVIVVNDGSTDNSLKIINKYIDNDNRVKLIDIDNAGVSNARNLGILNSNGDYIMFVDVDDYIECEYIENCINFLLGHKTNFLKTNYKRLIENKTTIVGLKENIELKNFDEIENIFFQKKYLCECWGSLINRNFLIENNLKFRTNLIYGEDTLFNFEILKKAKSMIYINNPGYIYYCNNSGITKNVNPSILKRKIDDLINIYDCMNNESKLVLNFIMEKIEYNLNLLILNINFKNFYSYYKELYGKLLDIKMLYNLDYDKFNKKIMYRIKILLKSPFLYYTIFRLYKYLKKR